MKERCGNQATLRYTWPGRDESYICDSCADKLDAVAQAIGLHIQLLPISADAGQQCEQQVKSKGEKN
jgi:hypothetical protein